MSTKPLRGGRSGLLALVCLLLPAAPGFVVAEERAAAIEEITVTARKREEPLQQTPVAVTALTGESLERVFATDITDLHVRAPNVIVSDISGFSSSAAVFIRGIGNADIDSTVDPPVAIFIDGIYIPRPANNSLDLFDVEQIEILRGPQGTLFGRNTTGGAIHYRTKRPTGEFGARTNSASINTMPACKAYHLRARPTPMAPTPPWRHCWEARTTRHPLSRPPSTLTGRTAQTSTPRRPLPNCGDPA